MSYGYRVFKVTAHKNGRGEPLPWSAELLDEVQLLVSELASSGVLLGTPHLRTRRADLAAEDAEPAGDGLDANERVTVFHDVVRVGPQHLHFSMDYGEAGRHPFLAGAGASRTDIRRLAAQESFRCDLFVPRDEEFALLALETSGAFSPNAMLYLHVTSRSRERIRDEEGKRQGDFLALRLRGQADAKHLRSIISSAKEAKAVFTDRENSARGRPVSRRLEINLKDKKYRDAGITEAGRWTEEIVEGAEERTDMLSAVRSMEQAFGIEAGVAALQWDIDEVGIYVQSTAASSPKLFAPGLTKQMFTYPIGGYQPSDESYYHAVTAKVQDLVSQYGWDLDVMSSGEVIACLTSAQTDSTLETLSEASEGVSGDEAP